jgi:hypothetical protein
MPDLERASTRRVDPLKKEVLVVARCFVQAKAYQLAVGPLLQQVSMMMVNQNRQQL